MNPVLTLGLVAAAGIAVTRLPRVPLRLPLHLDVVRAAGTPLLVLGLLLGPGVGVLDPPTLRALAPVTALASGWIGAVLGARFEWRLVRRIPTAVWALVLLQSLAVFGLVGTATWLFARFLPALAAAWSPSLPAILTLAAAATVSGPAAVALTARRSGIQRGWGGGRMAHAVGLVALLDSAFGALGFAIALGPHDAARPVFGTLLTWSAWWLLAAGSAVVLSLIFRALARLAPAGEVAILLPGTLFLAAGFGYAAGLPPFLVCALAAVGIVNTAPKRARVRKMLDHWERPLYAILLVIAGAWLVLPTLWIVAAVPVLAALRVAAKWAIVRYGRGPLRARTVAPAMGLATVAQGGVALAFGIDFAMTHGAATGGGGGGGGGVERFQMIAPVLKISFDAHGAEQEPTEDDGRAAGAQLVGDRMPAPGPGRPGTTGSPLQRRRPVHPVPRREPDALVRRIGPEMDDAAFVASQVDLEGIGVRVAVEPRPIIPVEGGVIEAGRRELEHGLGVGALRAGRGDEEAGEERDHRCQG